LSALCRSARLSVAFLEFDCNLQGVSLQYLRWLKTQVLEVWASCLTTSQFEKMYLRPRTARLRCSVIDALAADAATAHHIKPATWFISHVWSNPFSDVLDAILQFFEGREDAASAMLWWDVFVDSQHVIEGASKSPQWYMSTFKSSIAQIGRLLLVVDFWNNPTPLKRAWYEPFFSTFFACAQALIIMRRCVLELHAMALKLSAGGGEFAIAMTGAEKQRFLGGIVEDPSAYYDMLGTVNAEASDCSRIADRLSIHDGIRQSVGFVELGRMVFSVMEEWMLEELRTQVAAKQNEGDVKGELQWRCALGAVLRQHGKLEQAVEIYEHLLASVETNVTEDVSVRFKIMNGLSYSYFDLGRHQDGIAIEKCAIEFYMPHMQDDSADIQDQFDYMDSLGHFLHVHGKHQVALQIQQRLLDLRRQVLAPNSPSIGQSMMNVAVEHRILGQYDDALSMGENALEFLQQHLPPSHPAISDAMEGLAATYSRKGRDGCCLSMHRDVLEFRRRILPSNHPDIATAMTNFAVAMLTSGQCDEALEIHENALKLRQSVLSPDHPDIARSMDGIARVYLKIGRNDEALAIMKEQLENLQKVLPPKDPHIGSAMDGVAVAHYAMGQYADALAIRERQLDFYRQNLPPNHHRIVSSLNQISFCYEKVGNMPQSIACAQGALDILRATLPPFHENVTESEFRLRDLTGDSSYLKKYDRICKSCDVSYEIARYLVDDGSDDDSDA
jgi:tetratricopeptide (TPR) repeat protein